jgi:hypothetical protein
MRAARAAALVLGLAAFAAALAAGADALSGRVFEPVVKIDRPGSCVEPTAVMRRDHMKLLLEQRDRTLRLGIRDTRHSLKHCVECHANASTGSVLGKDGFCESCHRYASVSIDCFECHSPERQARVAERK